MRKSRSKTAETRCRIVESAATAIRQRGIEGTSVNDLMAAAGLTHGGFYRHFDSKDQLIAEACDLAFEAMSASLSEACGTCAGEAAVGSAAEGVAQDAAKGAAEAVAEGPGQAAAGGVSGLRRIADSFLSTANRDERVAGCPLTSIGSELARADAATRRVATEGLLRTIDLFARQFPGLTPEDARSRAVATLASMVGGITLARIVDDPALSDEILRDVRSAVGAGLEEGSG